MEVLSLIQGWLQRLCSRYCWKHAVKPNRKRKNKCVNTDSNVIMKQCRKKCALPYCSSR